ncbi:MAG: hypothetical protein LBB89_05000 [Treponema sp.]|nr:hypothetical protein [Treponema sp.]
MRRNYEKENGKMSNIDTNLFSKILAPENRFGIYIAIIVAVVGIASNHFLPSLQFLSYILQAITVLIMVAILDHYQHEIIKSATKEVLSKIEDKYKNITCKSTNLFKIFQLNDGGNYFNVAHNIFFNKLLESYSTNGVKQKYFIPIDTYYEIIKGFIGIGYKIKIINGMLLPFWYVPKEKDVALTSYTEFCKKNTDLYDRVTYYQDYDGDEWRDNTVKKIYNDLLTSEKSDDVAVRWLITLIANIEKLRTAFGNKIKEILDIELEKNFNYLQYHNTEIDDVIKKNIKKFKELLNEKYDNKTTISCEMTTIINDLFFEDMKGKNKFVEKSKIDNRFAEDNINFEDITEVGYYYKEDDQFVMFLNGSNTGPSVELEIITDKEKIDKIKRILSYLF